MELVKAVSHLEIEIIAYFWPVECSRSVRAVHSHTDAVEQEGVVGYSEFRAAAVLEK